ncbi:hypothetical protein [Pseudomonas syringae]|uniref:hypothetical protein n=1 Tax=Pseudomonas syringae TaxID=317 RepID=UPI00163FC15D|nr:hypothetical protein [Pseudomonas syringae]
MTLFATQRLLIRYSIKDRNLAVATVMAGECRATHRDLAEAVRFRQFFADRY